MLPELFSWWKEQMRDLAARFSRRDRKQRDALLLRAGADAAEGYEIIRRRNGSLMRVASLPPDAGDAEWRQSLAARARNEPVVIALARPFLLRQTSVPAAAAAYLDRWLRYEMDRLTPFSADDVWFSHHVRSRDRSNATLIVDVVLAPKVWVRGLTERLATLSVRPEAIEAPNEARIDAAGPEALYDHAPRRIPLDDIDVAARAHARLAWRLGVGVCAALAAALVALPLLRQSLALAGAEDELAALRPAMRQVDAFRQRIATGSAGANRIVAARERGTTALRVLGTLTDLLPDGTWLTSVQLGHGRLIIEGRSTQATKLISTMAADPELKNPSFAAPVVRGDNGTDIFTIQAGLGS